MAEPIIPNEDELIRLTRTVNNRLPERVLHYRDIGRPVKRGLRGRNRLEPNSSKIGFIQRSSSLGSRWTCPQSADF